MNGGPVVKQNRLPDAGRRHINLTAGTPAPIFYSAEQIAEAERRRMIAKRIRAAFASIRRAVETQRRQRDEQRMIGTPRWWLYETDADPRSLAVASRRRSPPR